MNPEEVSIPLSSDFFLSSVSSKGVVMVQSTPVVIDPAALPIAYFEP